MVFVVFFDWVTLFKRLKFSYGYLLLLWHFSVKESNSREYMPTLTEMREKRRKWDNL